MRFVKIKGYSEMRVGGIYRDIVADNDPYEVYKNDGCLWRVTKITPGGDIYYNWHEWHREYDPGKDEVLLANNKHKPLSHFSYYEYFPFECIVCQEPFSDQVDYLCPKCRKTEI